MLWYVNKNSPSSSIREHTDSALQLFWKGSSSEVVERAGDVGRLWSTRLCWNDDPNDVPETVEVTTDCPFRSELKYLDMKFLSGFIEGSVGLIFRLILARFRGDSTWLSFSIGRVDDSALSKTRNFQERGIIWLRRLLNNELWADIR